MSTAFQVVYKTKEYICFEIKFFKLTSSNGMTLNFLVNSRKEIFHNGNENNDMSAAQERIPLPIETVTQAHN